MADALDVPLQSLRPMGREPLGTGSISGFSVADGSDATAYLDTSGLEVVAETGFALADGTRVWLHPADPHLPALIPVAFEGAAGALLDRLGVVGLRSLEMAGYRPGRRAVLRADVEGRRPIWIKVVRPRRVERIVDVHRSLLAAGVPVPAVLGWAPDGLIVLDSADGEPATETAWEPAALLDAVEEVRTAIAEASVAGDARTSLAERLPWYAERLRDALGADHRIDDAAAAAAHVLEATAPARRTVIHGDLHLGQLFVTADDRRLGISGLIDVDTAGRGDAAEDEAAFLAHACASAVLTERTHDASRVWELADAARGLWADDDRVRALVQVHLLGHALTTAEHGDALAAGRLLDIAVAASSRGPLRSADSKTRLITGFDSS